MALGTLGGAGAFFLMTAFAGGVGGIFAHVEGAGLAFTVAEGAIKGFGVNRVIEGDLAVGVLDDDAVAGSGFGNGSGGFGNGLGRFSGFFLDGAGDFGSLLLGGSYRAGNGGNGGGDNFFTGLGGLGGFFLNLSGDFASLFRGSLNGTFRGRGSFYGFLFNLGSHICGLLFYLCTGFGNFFSDGCGTGFSGFLGCRRLSFLFFAAGDQRQ